MKRITGLFCIILAGIGGATAASLLEPASFPKTINDVSFVDRMKNLADGYEDFEEEYDADGRCIRGCAYAGITLKEADRLSEIATQEALAAIEEWEQEQQNNNNNDGTSTPSDTSNNNQTPPPSVTPPPVVTPPSVTPPPPAQPVPPSGYGCPSGRYSKYVQRNATIPMYPPLNLPLVVSSDFGKRRPPVPGASSWHPSIDLSATEGAPVYATASGTVVRVQNLAKGYGSNIQIKHDTGKITEYTQYSHLKRGSISVKEGDRIAAGCEIAKAGNTGTSSGPHLDYKIMGGNMGRIDPVYTKNRLGYDYKFTGPTSPEHQGLKLPGRN